MSLLSQLHQRGAVESVTTITVPASPPNRPPIPPTSTGSSEAPEAQRCIDDAQRLTRILLADADDDAMAALEAGVDELVDVWTPAGHMGSRLELMSALADVDDAIGDVVVSFTESAWSAGSAFVAWTATGRFVRPASLDDDRILDPDGSVIRAGGVTTVSFDAGHRADRIRCYYDRLTLIEQLAGRRPVTGAA